MSLIDRISAYNYDEDQVNRIISNELDDVIIDLAPESSSLIIMLENIINRSRDLYHDILYETDILIENQRWKENKEEWSSHYLSQLDWNVFEATPIIKAPTLAEFHCKHGIIWSNDGITSPLPECQPGGPMIWKWKEESWRLSNEDLLKNQDGWWYGTCFPKNKTVENVKKMSRQQNKTTFVRCRLWYRTRIRNSLKFILNLIISNHKQQQQEEEEEEEEEEVNHNEKDAYVDMSLYSIPSLQAALISLLKVRQKIHKEDTSDVTSGVINSGGGSADDDDGGSGGGGGSSSSGGGGGGGGSCDSSCGGSGGGVGDISNLETLSDEFMDNSKERLNECNNESSPHTLIEYEIDVELWIKESLQLDQVNSLNEENIKDNVKTSSLSLKKKAWEMMGGLTFGRKIKFDMEAEIIRASETIRRMTNIVDESKYHSNKMKIPQHLLRNAKGVAIVSTVKVGFLVGGRIGCGLVLTRTKFGWSAPSAILLFGLGGGLQIGAEVGRLLLVLNTDDAIKAFCGGTQITLGADIGVSIGPIGRHAGAAVSSGRLEHHWKKKESLINSTKKSSTLKVKELEMKSDIKNNCAEEEEEEEVDNISYTDDDPLFDSLEEGGSGKGAAIYSYAYQKGLFMSMLSLEGTVITPRSDVNHKFYSNITATTTTNQSSSSLNPTPNELLSGMVSPPEEAKELYGALYDAFEKTSEVEALALALAVE